MFPFWDLAIAPILAAIETKRCVEIGALRGETTIRMLDDLGPAAELHVIDPVPEFDPGEHERAFPGRYIFHRDLSLNVLSDLPPMDAALIDGDHNWYTVYHECKALAEVARAHDAPLPVMILHDVCWPYGRRDLYYGPDGVPAEFRQPFAQQGMLRGVSDLLPGGGLNPTMYNATHEGGPRNGVMTGLDDFIAEHDQPVRLLVLPIYFGLAIVAEQQVLDAHPKLVEVLDHLESAEGRAQLLELGENIRLDAMMFEHAIFFQREQTVERAAQRYLGVVKKALLDEHYIENEVRIKYLAFCIEKGLRPRASDLRDPERHYESEWKKMQALRLSGRSHDTENPLAYFSYSDMGQVRLDRLHEHLDVVRTEKVPGDLMEVGTGRGGGGIFLRSYLDAYEMLGRGVWVADLFRAELELDTTAPDTTEPFVLAEMLPFARPDLNTVRGAFERFDLLDDRVHFVQGELAHAIPKAPIEKLALLRLGTEVGESALEVLEDLYDKVAMGGFVVVGEYFLDEDLRAAVDEFRRRRGVPEILERIDGVAAFWRKLENPVAPDPATLDDTDSELEPAVEPDPAPGSDASGGTDEDEGGEATRGLAASAKALLDKAPGAQAVRDRLRKPREERHPISPVTAVGAPLPAPVTAGHKDLSVIIVFWNMKREAARTLQSLARSYQRGIDDLDYEVIVVENGSAPDQKLDDEFVRSFGPQFRYIDLAEHAQPSPVFALNYGLACSGGRNICFMIDGAHVLTPGVLRHGVAGLRTYAPSMVAVQQWYVGPGQQPTAIQQGYDQTYEDRLFEQIEFPIDGYRLFDIGHFIGERDWFDGLWESNCIFATRAQLEQVGAFDESFSMAGGGYANLEIYERLTSSADINVTTILGEGSFHQVHGGTTTNQTDNEERLTSIDGYALHYADVRGRDFHGQGKELFYVGTMSPSAARTRARRRTAPDFFTKGMAGDPDAAPKQPVPIVDELNSAFTEAYWRTLCWQDTTWLGRRVGKTPEDMLTYQEMVHDLRPDWIVFLRTRDGGQAAYFASLCDLVDHGQVLSIDDRERDGLPEHPRLQYLVGSTYGADTQARVREIIGPDANALVVLGTCGGGQRMIMEFDTYKDFVPVGSYVVIEETIVNGHPVWPSFGPGPYEAAHQVLLHNRDFRADPSREKYVLTFNPGGFLKRIE